MNKPKVSVIIPVYRVEIYLDRCIQSVLNQSYQNLEIILVDDGSPDRCGEICDRYAQQDPRVEVIHQPNGGLSAARNTGIDHATGEYLYFLDSDDFIHPQAIEVLHYMIEQSGAKVAIGSVSSDKEGMQKIRFPVKFETIRTKELIPHLFLAQRGFAAWGRVIERSLFTNLRFPVGRINEDFPTMIPLYDKCEEVVKTDLPLYHYIKREESITTSKISLRSFDIIPNAVEVLHYIDTHRPEWHYQAESILAFNMVGLAVYAAKNKQKEFLPEIDKIRFLLKQSIFSILRNRFVTLNTKMLLGLLLISRRCFNFTCRTV